MLDFQNGSLVDGNTMTPGRARLASMRMIWKIMLVLKIVNCKANWSDEK